MKNFISLMVVFVLLIAGGAVYFWSGAYNVAATEPHWDIVRSFMEKARDRSVVSHSKGINLPSLEDPNLVETAFPHFHEMCRLCHGAPGYPPTEFAQGLYPSPPDLSSGSIQQRWNNAQIFWIIKNGFKMTGMPAFGPTHEDDELWALVAFLRRLPSLNKNDYGSMAQETSPHLHNPHDGEEHHKHGRDP